MKRILALVVIGLWELAGSEVAFGQSAGPPFVSFQQFLGEVETAKLETFRMDNGAKVLDEVEFGKMRRHILSLYDGVEVAHSFVLVSTGPQISPPSGR